jgi:ActR/RegA family two-component response regulator
VTASRTCWGIYREAAHSPGRIEDDRAILKSVAEALEARGFTVELVSADAEFETHFANIFAMCERGVVLDRLRAAEKTGSIVVNSSDAIRNT